MLNTNIRDLGIKKNKPMQIKTRVSEDDYRRVCAAAARNGMRMSDYLRAATLQLLTLDETERGEK